MTRLLGSKKRELAGRVGRVSCVGVCYLLSRTDVLRRIVVWKLMFYQVPILKSQRRVDNDEAGGQQKDQSKAMEVEFFEACLPFSLLATATNSKSEKTSLETTSLKPTSPPLSFRNLT